MFRWINKQGVESDAGFVVQFTGRWSAEYRERGSRMTIEIEDVVVGGLPGVAISPNAFEKWDDGARLTSSEQIEILSNFRNACEFQGLKLVLDSPRA